MDGRVAERGTGDRIRDSSLPPSRVRTLGVEYITRVFVFDFAKKPFHGGIVNLLVYLPFLALAVAGPALRLAAALKRLSQPRTVAA